MLQINNIVATYSCGTSFTPEDYLQLARGLPNAEYRPRQFHAIRMRVRISGHTATALLFRSGRIVMSGVGKTEKDATRVARRVSRRIGFALWRKCQVQGVCIRNVAGSAQLGHQLLPSKLLRSTPATHGQLHVGKASFDPELFSAVRIPLRMDGGAKGAVALCFRNGKLILTGAKSVHELHEIFVNFVDFISK